MQTRRRYRHRSQGRSRHLNTPDAIRHRRALAKAYGPWLALVTHPPGAGTLWAQWPGEHPEAANDRRY